MSKSRITAKKIRPLQRTNVTAGSSTASIESASSAASRLKLAEWTVGSLYLEKPQTLLRRSSETETVSGLHLIVAPYCNLSGNYNTTVMPMNIVANDRWPVTDLIKMRLKNTSSKHKKLLEKVAMGKFGGQDIDV